MKTYFDKYTKSRELKVGQRVSLTITVVQPNGRKVK